MEKDKPKNFTLVWYGNGSHFGKRINRMETKSIRRFRRKLKLLPNQIRGNLRVSYSGGGYNQGEYENKADILFAFDAFMER